MRALVPLLSAAFLSACAHDTGALRLVDVPVAKVPATGFATDFEKAESAAKARKSLLFVFFTAPW